MTREEDVAEGLELQKNLPRPRYPQYVGARRESAWDGVGDPFLLTDLGPVGCLAGVVAVAIGAAVAGFRRRSK